MSAIIYLLTNTLNGKQYIGQTTRLLETRWKEHCCHARNGSPFNINKAIRKYGPEVFTIEVLEQTTPESINEREVYWIDEINPEYNMTVGGSGTRGWIVTEETRAKMSAASRRRKYSDETKARMSAAKSGKNHPNYGKKRSPETIAKIRASHVGDKNPMYGKTLPEEQKAKISASLKGRVISDETRAKISTAHKGRKFSNETLSRMKESARRRERMKRIIAPIATIGV